MWSATKDLLCCCYGGLNHSWGIGVVSHYTRLVVSYGGLDGSRDGGGGWYACKTRPGGIGRMLGDVGALPDCEVEH